MHHSGALVAQGIEHWPAEPGVARSNRAERASLHQHNIGLRVVYRYEMPKGRRGWLVSTHASRISPPHPVPP